MTVAVAVPEPMEDRCPYCGSSDGTRSVHMSAECRGCGRILQERQVAAQELYSETVRDVPLCVVAPRAKKARTENHKAEMVHEAGNRTENSQHQVLSTSPTADEDQGRETQFLTAFSTSSLESVPLFTAASTSFPGHLAELERLFGDILYSEESVTSASTSEYLRAYFQILEVASVVGLDRDIVDHAVRLFRDCCSSSTYLRNRNVEALATAALVQAMREGQEPRTLQEVAAAAGIPQKEMGRHMKVLSDALKVRPPLSSSGNCIAVHMPRFCGILQLQKSTQDLATHIGEVVMSKSFCTRRNPISISAAAIYLSCQLEDKRKTQTEICKATGLTEVTLRKVYKELLENLDALLPLHYTPAVPPEKAFPVTAAALGRVCANRVAAALGEGGGGGEDEPAEEEHSAHGAGSSGRPEGQQAATPPPGSDRQSQVSGPSSAEFPVAAGGARSVPGLGGPGRGERQKSPQAGEEAQSRDAGREQQAERRAEGNAKPQQQGAAGEGGGARGMRGQPSGLGPETHMALPGQSLGAGLGPAGFRPPMFPFPGLDPRMLREMPFLWPPAPHMYAAMALGARPPEGGVGAGPRASEGATPGPPFLAYPGMAEAAAAAAAAGGGGAASASMGLEIPPHLRPSWFEPSGGAGAGQMGGGGDETAGDKERGGDSEREWEHQRERERERERGRGEPQESGEDSGGQCHEGANHRLPNGGPSGAPGTLAAGATPGPPRSSSFPPFPNLWPFMAATAGPAAAAAWGRMFPPQMLPRAAAPGQAADARSSVAGLGPGLGQAGGVSLPGVPPNLAEAMARSIVPTAAGPGIPPMWPSFHHMLAPPGAPAGGGSVEGLRRGGSGEQALQGGDPRGAPGSSPPNGPLFPMLGLGMTMNIGMPPGPPGEAKGADQASELSR